MALTAEQVLAICMQYTKDTVEGAGAIAGKNCTIDSIEAIEGGNRVTFKYTLDNGTVKTKYMDVMDGTDGQDGSDGVSPSISIEEITGGHKITITDAEHPEGQTLDVLDGAKGDPGEKGDPGDDAQYSVMPEANADNLGKIVQYVGETTGALTNGYFYKCTENAGVYSWTQKSVQPGGGSGGTDDYEDLENKPQVNGNILVGNKTASDLGLVAAETGKGLSKNDYTDEDKAIVGGVSEALDDKVDKHGTDSLMTADEHTKLSGIEAGAEENVIEKISVNGTQQTVTNKEVALTIMTNAVNDLLNYYKKSETYTQAEVDALIAGIVTLDLQAVDQLPTQDISTTTIYLVPSADPQTQNVRDEYIYLNGAWEMIGSTAIDLSNYVTTTALNTALADYATTAAMATALADKVDKVAGKGLSTEDYTTSEKNKLAGLENYDDTAVTGRLDNIEGEIPSGASSSNKLVTNSELQAAVVSGSSGSVFKIVDPNGDYEGETVRISHGTAVATGTITDGVCYLNMPEVGRIKVEIGNDIVRYVTVEYYKDVVVSTQVMYGFTITQSNSTPDTRVTYIEDNAGFTPAKMDYTFDKFDYGDWKDAFFMPRPCMLKNDGTVDYYLDPDDYRRKEDGTLSDIADSSYAGDVMVEFPKIWVKRTESNGVQTTLIASYKADNDFHCYSNLDAEGNEIDHFYVAAYDGCVVSNKLRSLSGKTPVNTVAGTTLVQNALNNNDSADYTKNGYYISQWCDRALINDLLILIGRSTNTQAIFGNGHYTGGSAASSLLVTGTLDAKGMFYGKNTTGVAVKVFGIENYFGNLWKWCAGLMANGAALYAKMTWGTDDGSAGVGYDTTGVGNSIAVGKTAGGTSGGYISQTYNSELGNIPFTASGGEATYECDGLWFNASAGVKHALVGGPCYDGLHVGAFALSMDSALSISGWAVGAALSCKPPIGA